MNTLQFFDTHAHLCSTQFDDDRTMVLQRMQAANVTRHLEIAYSLESSRRVVEFAHSNDQCWSVVGVQPNHPEDALQLGWIEQLRHIAQHPKVVAIGEIGFDHFHKKAPVDVQEQMFRKQITLAAERKLPIVIHSRDAHADTLRVLRDVKHPYGVVMHSFAGDLTYARECIALGCTLSLSGPITFRNNLAMQLVVQQLDLAHVMIETDSPYLAPHPYRGKRNEPSYVVQVAQQIALLHECRLEDIAHHTWHNACRVFGLPLS
ncbi:MAG: TatD family hydrolase [Chloroflexales bacterium]|nr:TatD family hydrolase [Chloroflexales bacterium]